MARRDYLIEEVRGLLIERQITKLVNDQQRGLGERFQFSHERMIDLRSQQMIEHVHGSGEDDTLIGLACLPSEDAGEEGLAHAGIADQHQVGALF